MIKYIFLFIPFIAQAQTDTLSTRTYTNTLKMVSLNGLTTSGHPYAIALKMNYAANGSGLPFEFVRVDLVTKQVTYKVLPGSVSSELGVLWRFAMDSTGNMYFGLNTANRYVVRCNFKDSIWFKSLGNTAMDNTGELVYSMQLGRDGHMYFGYSSGPTSTKWTEYDPVLDTLYKHPEIDETQGYVLGITGDNSGWAYAQVGQNTTNSIWAINKDTNAKTKLLSVSSNTIFNFSGGAKNGIYVSQGGNTWKLKDGVATTPPDTAASGIVYYFEVNDGVTYQNGAFHTVKMNFDIVTSRLVYTLDNVLDSVALSSTLLPNTFRTVYCNEFNQRYVYTVGEYYGVMAVHDTLLNTDVDMGNIGFNIYSIKAKSDTAIILSGYPSGVVACWNTSLAWTVGKFANGAVVGLSPTSNPRLLGYLRNETEAGIHHANNIRFIGDWIIVAGDVIRTNNSFSVAGVNYRTGAKIGYDQNKLDGCSFASSEVWNNKYVVSSNNSYGGHPKIYFYDTTGIMVDSIDKNWPNHGQIFITGDQLLGVTRPDLAAPTDSLQFYKINLSTKAVTYSKTIPGVLNYVSLALDGTLAINTTGAVLPKDFWQFKVVPYTYYTRTEPAYSVTGNYVVKVKGFSNMSVDINSAPGKEWCVKKVLGLQ